MATPAGTGWRLRLWGRPAPERRAADQPQQVTAAGQAPSSAVQWATAVPPLVVPVAVPRAVTASPDLAAAGARLALVPVPTSPDPLVDTVPHPVVKLFPMPVVDAEDAVFAAEDAAREIDLTAELAAGIAATAEAYQARHTATA